MKTILSILNHPVTVLLSSISGSVMMVYLQDMVIQVISWYIPCIAIIIADLAAGIKAARFRKETVRLSSAARRTINKGICYLAWIIFCVALNKQYNMLACAPVGMGMIFFIEGISFFTNILEPHGIRISIKGVLKILGGKLHIDGLDDIVEEHE